MLKPDRTPPIKSLHYEHLKKDENLIYLSTIGWDKVNSADYRWEGMKRKGPRVHFQLTLSGAGAFRYGGETYTIDEGKGFLCLHPSEHDYYFDPRLADEWEFFFLVATGEDAFRHWRTLIDSHGPVFDFSSYAAPAAQLIRLFDDLRSNPKLDKYAMSQGMYAFVTELYKMRDTEPDREQPDYIRTIVAYIEKHYAGKITIDNLSELVNISRFHLTKQFVRYTGMKPVQYMTKTRIEKAARLLISTDKTLKEIAKETGFDNPNYFVKVFRKWIGMTPGHYRSGKFEHPVDVLRIDR